MTDIKALNEKAQISLNKYQKLLDAIYKVEPIELFREISNRLQEYNQAQAEYEGELLK